MNLPAVTTESYGILATKAERLKHILDMNLGGMPLNPWDLPRIKIPAGGATTWTLPGLAGGEQAKTFTGIIIHRMDRRAYWQSRDGGSGPPDCQSPDAIHGFGMYGGVCSQCPMSAFPKQRGTGGPSCKRQILLFVLRGQSLLPTLLSLPPTGVAPWSKYIGELTDAGLIYSEVETVFALHSTTNPAGQKYAVVDLGFSALLTPEQADLIRPYSELIRGAANAGAEFYPDDSTAPGQDEPSEATAPSDVPF